jgi:hypothetical protein
VSASKLSRPPHLSDDVGRLATALGLAGGAATHELDQPHFQRLVRFPQFSRVDTFDPIPDGRVAGVLEPVGAQVAVIQPPHLWCEPCLNVDTVGDMSDRHAILGTIEVQRPPHRA